MYLQTKDKFVKILGQKHTQGFERKQTSLIHRSIEQFEFQIKKIFS